MDIIRRLFIVQPQKGGRDRSTDYTLGKVLEELRDLRNEVRQLRRDIRIMQEQVQEAFAQLQTEVQAVRDTEQAAVTLIGGLQQQLTDALNSGGDPSEIVAAVQAITTQLETDAAPLAAAVATSPSGGGEDTGAGGDGSGGDATDPTV